MKNVYSTSVGVFATLRNGDHVAIVQMKDGSFKSMPLANKSNNPGMLPLADIAPKMLLEASEEVYNLNLCTIPGTDDKAEFTFATAVLSTNKELPHSSFPKLEVLFAKNSSRVKFVIDPAKTVTFTAEPDGTVRLSQGDSFRILGKSMPLGVEFHSITTATSELFCGSTPGFDLKKTVGVFKKADDTRGIPGTDWAVIEATATARLVGDKTAPEPQKKPTVTAGPLQLGGAKQEETKKPAPLQLGSTKPSSNALQLGASKSAAVLPVMPKGLSNKQKKAWREANLQPT